MTIIMSYRIILEIHCSEIRVVMVEKVVVWYPSMDTIVIQDYLVCISFMEYVVQRFV